MLRFLAVPGGLALTLLLALTPGRARACELLLTGEPSSAWQKAVEELSPEAVSGEECAQLQLEVRGTIAQLTLVTRDRRRAERTLGSPDELAPALAALRVVDPPSSPAPARVASPAQEQRRISPLFALLTGVRAGEGALLAPVLHTSMLMLLRQRWELGLFGAWETRYFKLYGRDELTAREDATRLGAGLVGTTFAYRQQRKRAVLLGGARLAYDRESSRYERRPAFNLDNTLPSAGFLFPSRHNFARTGLFAGVSFPARGTRARLRAELGVDLRFPWEAGRESGRMNVPNWAFTALVGLELGRP